MRVWFRLGALIVAAGMTLPADTILLRNGRQVDGTFMGGDSRQVKLLGADGKLQTFDIGEIESIRFKGAPAASQAAPSPSPAPAGSSMTVPAGTVITVRLIDSVDSDVNQTGERFRASLDQPLQVGEKTVAPRGADATVQLVRVEQAGRLTGREEVALDLYELVVSARRYPVASSYAEVSGDSRTSSTGKVVGGTAALGAIIGAIAGGGKGAAIGAASGAGAGAAVQAVRGAKVKIPSETRLEFTLKQPLVVQ
jgi:hypothetical protein